MQYKPFGKTGKLISRLGMGCMRLPLLNYTDMKSIDEAETERMAAAAIEHGINYFDSAYGYHGGESEKVIGKILQPVRSKVYLATKLPGWQLRDVSDFRKIFEDQLRRLRTDYIDFYHLHSINKKFYLDLDKKYQWISQFQKLKEEGLVHHLSFSFHGPAEDVAWLVETRVFESMLCQYSILDRSNLQGMKRAAELGLGVAVMGPVAGGRITEFGPEVVKGLAISDSERARLALQFVWANPHVHCAVSGMSSLAQVEDNLLTERESGELSQRDHETVLEFIMHLEKLGTQYCTACRYCLPCPQEIPIPDIFTLKIYNDIYGMTHYAKQEYESIGKVPWMPGKRASDCIECGECESKCPQKIPIMQQLKECARLFEE